MEIIFQLILLDFLGILYHLKVVTICFLISRTAQVYK